MLRKVFYSFHYQKDAWRASQIRNIGVIDGSKPASDNDWETVKRGGDNAIQRWIDGQLSGRSCTVVLIGEDTSDRKWVKYEIKKSWELGKGVVGIHIHNLKDMLGEKGYKGTNPFNQFSLPKYGKKLSQVIKTYDPPHSHSKDVYEYISIHLSSWIEEAVRIRSNY